MQTNFLKKRTSLTERPLCHCERTGSTQQKTVPRHETNATSFVAPYGLLAVLNIGEAATHTALLKNPAVRAIFVRL
jgi:hypothetical protein